MDTDIRTQTTNGIFWSAIEKFSLQGVQLIIGIIMARLLTPNDYGLIGMLAIFMAISQVFIDGGFSTALVQKKERTESDFSTAFYINLSISLILYIVLYLAAPFISDFFNESSLTPLTRVYSINLVINALAAVNKTKLTILVDFKTLSKISVISALISGVIGIYFAYTGYAVWALVIQTLIGAVITVILSFIYVRWIPKSKFSIKSFKELFSFGSKLLIAQLIGEAYSHLYSLAIGKKFSTESLGLYTRSNQFASFASFTMTGILTRVSLPILSQLQDDDTKLINIYRKYLKCAVFVVFPVILGLCGVAKPFILLLLTDKWAGCILPLQILCFSYLTTCVTQVNLNLLYVKGRSDLVLKLEIAKKSLALVILFITIFNFDLIGVCVGLVIYSVLAMCMNTYYTYKLLHYGLLDQLRDIVPCLVLSLFMMVIALFTSELLSNYYLALLVSVISSFLFYAFTALYFKFDAAKELKELIFKFIKR